MVRVRRRGMALACAGVLVVVALALGSAVAPGAARAATLSAADLEKQGTTIAQTLQEAADDLGYYYRDDDVQPFGRWNLSLAAVKAKMMLYVSSGDSANGDESGIDIVQFDSPEAAKDFADKALNSPNLLTLGGHQAYVIGVWVERDHWLSEQIVWICSKERNLVALGVCSTRGLERSQEDILRTKLVGLATKVHDRLVAAGVCDNGAPTTKTTLPTVDSMLQTLFDSADTDIVAYVKANAWSASLEQATVNAYGWSKYMEDELLAAAQSIPGLLNIPEARDACARWVFLATLTDNSGRPLFPTLKSDDVGTIIRTMAVLSVKDATAVNATQRLLTILSARDMQNGEGAATK